MSASTEVRSRPILFSGPMVRAILDGRKTQTRRVVKPQPDWIRPRVSDDGIAHGYCGSGPTDGIKCPYGTVGDRLWVRETWRGTEGLPGTLSYRASYPFNCKGWKTSTCMPRWASRIDLEITGIRVERLQEISEQDAIAEGIDKSVFGNFKHYGSSKNPCGDWLNPENSFMTLWNSINGQDSWSANPWVWVIEFKRIKP